MNNGSRIIDTTSARAGAAIEPNLLIVAQRPTAALLVDVGNISEV